MKPNPFDPIETNLLLLGGAEEETLELAKRERII